MSNRKSQSHSRSLLAMGFFRLPSENPAAPVQSESSEVSHQQKESGTLVTSPAAEASNQQPFITSGTPEAEVIPAVEAPNQPSGDYNFPKRKFGGANRSFKLTYA